MLSIKVETKNLQNKIQRFAIATGRTREDICRQSLKSMVKFATQYTPPGNKKAPGPGSAARDQGQGAIIRDLKNMGFRPVQVKHKENPLFANPDAYHHAYLEKAVTKMIFYAEKGKFDRMVKRLFAEVGKVVSGWISACVELEIPLPSWIYRQAGEDRGTVKLARQENITTMSAINHIPDKASSVYSEMARQKIYWVRYAAASLDRQLKAKLAGAWGK